MDDVVEVVAFDVFGTLVDWQTSIAGALARVGRRAGIEADWPELANAWRALYHPTLNRVVEGGHEVVALRRRFQHDHVGRRGVAEGLKGGGGATHDPEDAARRRIRITPRPARPFC